MPVSVAEVALGARFFLGAASFLRQPIRLDEAQAVLQRRLERRQQDFLAVVRSAVFANENSPYRKLLGLAGCEFHDLERMVGSDGVDSTLFQLYQQGVYLTVEELKGRRPVVRGSASFSVQPPQLRNPSSAFTLVGQTSGSRGPSTPVQLSLVDLRERTINRCLSLQARGGAGWSHAYWGIPGSGGLNRMLQYSVIASPPVRWFSQVPPASPALHPRYRWSVRALRAAALLNGMRLPAPVHVGLDNPLPIIDWMKDQLGSGRTPHLQTLASSAARLAQVAEQHGISLAGAQLTAGGEPLTEGRLAQINRVGAQVVPTYSAVEAGRIGQGCLAPMVSDDMHLMNDLVAVIQPGTENGPGGLPPQALLVSSIRSSASTILLNASLGDQATLTRRACDCGLQRFGWSIHLHTIRSFEKLTAGGMTFLDTDIVRVLEEVLPARFGGGPTSYQLVEEETAEGQPRVSLLVDPDIGPLNAESVCDVFLSAIGGGSGVERVMELHWRQARLLSVSREKPRTTLNGKIRHLHVGRGQRPARSR